MVTATAVHHHIWQFDDVRGRESKGHCRICGADCTGRNYLTTEEANRICGFGPEEPVKEVIIMGVSEKPESPIPVELSPDLLFLKAVSLKIPPGTVPSGKHIAALELSGDAEIINAFSLAFQTKRVNILVTFG